MRRQSVELGELVRFVWFDSCGTGGWTLLKDIDGEYMYITSVGGVIRNNNKAITIAQSVNVTSGESVDNYITVPWVNITEFDVL